MKECNCEQALKLKSENMQLKKAVNVKNLIIENAMKSIELLKSERGEQ